MTDCLAGKTALVTGGASGIGRAAALAYARAGAKVLVADVDLEGADETVSFMGGLAGTGLSISSDVSRGDEVERMVNAAVDAWGQLDCAFNNAGIQGELAQTAACTEENWDQITGVNLKGVWLCMKYEILQMLKQGSGAIVNNASNFGVVGSNGMPAYSASKHGVLGLTKTAAIEYAERGVRINAVCPGPVQTPLVDKIIAKQPEIVDAITEREPIGRMGQPDEIAGAVVWLCSAEASFVIGAVLAVDGGFVAQ